MTSLEEFNEKLSVWDKTIELWDSIPKSPLVLYEDEENVDWTEDDWTCSFKEGFEWTENGWTVIGD